MVYQIAKLHKLVIHRLGGLKCNLGCVFTTHTKAGSSIKQCLECQGRAVMIDEARDRAPERERERDREMACVRLIRLTLTLKIVGLITHNLTNQWYIYLPNFLNCWVGLNTWSQGYLGALICLPL